LLVIRVRRYQVGKECSTIKDNQNPKTEVSAFPFPK